MLKRPRILRSSPAIRSMVAETILTPNDFIVPLFVIEGKSLKEEITSMPNYHRMSLDLLQKEVKELWSLGIKSVLLFIKCDDELKDNKGTEAINDKGLMQRAIRAVKEAQPEMLVMTDVALDPYSSFGHDGIVEGTEIVNDATVEVLAQMSVSHAEAGADFVAPSDMMDGRIQAIRTALEKKGFTKTGIMSYSAKYASCFYGPFRDALDSAPGFGDKKSYQMDIANRKEAIKETLLDIEEGADIVMVKPALAYLDIIREVKNQVSVPVSAYQVSGEYAMIKAAAKMGCILPEKGFLEQLRQLCTQEGIILIFDEVMTGFRLAPGGAQEKLGIDADLITYGKVIGGGMPVGAFGGKKEIMSWIAPLGKVYQAGTLSGNPIAMIAGYTLLKELKENPSIYDELEKKGAYLETGLHQALKKSKKPYIINRLGSMISVHFSEKPVKNFDDAATSDNAFFNKFFHGMLAQGVYLPPSAYESWFLSNALSYADLDFTINAVERTLNATNL